MNLMPPSYKNQEEKKKYFSMEIINTEDDLKRLFKEILPEKYNQKGIWRGLPESRFKLYNTLQREDIPFKRLLSVDNVINSIKNSATYFDSWQGKIIPRYFRNYRIENISIFAKLSILRHYGVPSPLIDWTRDPRFALFFATQDQSEIANNEIDEYFSIYYITTDHPYYKLDAKLGYREVLEEDDDFRNEVNKRINFVFQHGGDNILQQEAKIKAENELLQIALNDLKLTLSNIKKQNIQRIEDQQNDGILHYIRNNLNITAQSGLFIINTDPIRPLEDAIFSRINELAKQDNELDVSCAMKRHKENFFCFDIHKRFTERIIRELNKQNIRKETMEPDLKKLKDDITFEMITAEINR